MGFLESGLPLEWENSKSVIPQVKKEGILQFLAIWELNKDRTDTTLKWGEELELTLVEVDVQKQVAKLWFHGPEIIEKLGRLENRALDGLQADWHPEFASFMVEALPHPVYNLSTDSILDVEKSMFCRRMKVQKLLPPNVMINSMTVFPNIGVGEWTSPSASPHPDTSASNSGFIPDAYINPHPRFPTLVRNIVARRKAKMMMLTPIMMDKETCKSADWSEALDMEKADRHVVGELSKRTPNPVKSHIYMDMFGFGMGMSCVQATFLCPDLGSARYLYDQLAVLAPLWLPLTASAPFFRGMLADVDTRWTTLAQSVDCRTQEEMKIYKKSRFGSVNLFISNDSSIVPHLEFLNDVETPRDPDALRMLLDAGIDEQMANHISYLWIRDPMVIFEDRINVGERHNSEHFENIQSTNWHSIRFKPPPAMADGTPCLIGWRVEFRTPDIQITDFENAASTTVLMMIVKMLLRRRPSLYMPISKVDENFARSEKQNSIISQQFWFPSDIFDGNDFSCKQMSLHEIFFGCSGAEGNGNFEGIISMAISEANRDRELGLCSAAATAKLQDYADFISARTEGTLMTNATYFRNLVMSHPDYANDSVVPSGANFDIVRKACCVGFGQCAPDELFGKFKDSVFDSTRHCCVETGDGTICAAVCPNGEGPCRKDSSWMEAVRSSLCGPIPSPRCD